MNKIIAYDAVTGWNIKELIEEVREKMKYGWQPYGEMNICHSGADAEFVQTLVKYESAAQ